VERKTQIAKFWLSPVRLAESGGFDSCPRRIRSGSPTVEQENMHVISTEEPMPARAKRLPGQPGAKALLKIYGDRLICVRYRYDREQRKRYKTGELIVEEAAWEPASAVLTPDTTVYLHAAWGEAAVARQIKGAGGHCRHDYKLRAIRYAQAEQIQRLDRMVDPDVQ